MHDMSSGPVLVVIAHPNPRRAVKTYIKPRNHYLVHKKRKDTKKTNPGPKRRVVRRLGPFLLSSLTLAPLMLSNKHIEPKTCAVKLYKVFS